MSTIRIIETISESTDIETKQLVSELSEYLSPEKQEQLHLPSYDNYALDLRKSTSETLYLNYLRELKQLISERKNGLFKLNVTASQNKMIMGRKIWSDVVQETDKYNDEYINKYHIKNKVISRIKNLGYDNEDKLYEDCLACLKNNTAIIISFDASSLNLESGAIDFQRLNIFECSTKGKQYLKDRNQTEIDFMHYLSKDLKKSFIDNIHARPRYGILQLLDHDHPPNNAAMGGYGHSFIVLNECAKMNCLFAAKDTMYPNNGKPWTMCTLYHPEILLHECDEKKLHAIIARTQTGKFSNFYGYFEAQMPGFNLLSDIVSHIHISKCEYELSQENINEIKEMGISITNDYGDIYKNEWKEKYQVIQSSDKEQNISSDKQGLHNQENEQKIQHLPAMM